jgi:hypothetical protein
MGDPQVLVITHPPVRWFLSGEMPAAEAVPTEEAASRRELEGRLPLIVPPTAAKSTYYQIPLLTQLWQDARTALSKDDIRVSIVGYSMPLTDLVTSGMLRETLTERSDESGISIDLVNPCPAPVLGRLGALGADLARVTPFESVEAFTAEYQVRAAREVVDALRRWNLPDMDCLLLVGPSVAQGAKVVNIRRACDELLLILEEHKPPYTSTNISPTGVPPPLGLRELLPHLDDTTWTKLVAIGPNGDRRPIVALAEHITNVGAGNGQWQVLVTTEAIRG